MKGDTAAAAADLMSCHFPSSSNGMQAFGGGSRVRSHDELPRDNDSGNESGRNSDYRNSSSVDSQLALLRTEMVSFKSCTSII